MTSKNTLDIANKMKECLEDRPGTTINAATIAYCFNGKNNITAAVSYLKKNNVIEVANNSFYNHTPNYRLSEVYLAQKKEAEICK